MSRLVIAGLVVGLACTARAGGNPDVRCYIDFDPPNYVHAVTPEPYETIEAYVCLDQLGEGMTSVSLCIDNPDEACPGCFGPAAWVKLLPGGFGGSPPWSPDGYTVVSDQCMTDSVTLVGKIVLFYLGGEYCIRLLDHPNYPRWVADCGNPAGVDTFCILAHGSIGGADCPDGDCQGVPVQDDTWGTIKSMYR